MKKLQLPSGFTRAVHKVGFQLKKHSPEICVVGGVIGMGVGAVMACKATTKLNTVLEGAKKDIDDIHASVEAGEVIGTDKPYTEEDGKKDLTITYVQTGVKLVKLYGPAIAVGTASAIGILAGHNILRKRTAAISAAYAAVDQSFKEYRGRVVDRFGKELDRELRYNIKAKEVEEIVTNEDGTETTITTTVDTVNPSDFSLYARIFDETCDNWTKDPEYNLMFLKQTESWANKKLKSDGYLYLNDVYEMLGFQKTKAGQIVGWVYDEECPNGDNYIDFGIFNNLLKDEPKRRFVNGYERSIILDFNVDGNIWELMQ